MRKLKILVSGAGIAGPAVAYWLSRYGCEVTVVEKAPGSRPGGQAVDFKGAAQLEVLARMGVLEEVRRRQTGGSDQVIVDGAGRRLAVMPAEFTGGEVEILRGDLAALLHERTAGDCAYVFGDSIAALEEAADGVRVAFERGAPGVFDLVVGADGIHSTVRGLAFGPEERYVRHLGYYYALARLDVDGAGEMYNEPGRMVSLGGPEAASFFVFASGPLAYDRFDVDEQRRVLADAYRGGGWRIPEVLREIAAVDDVYVDAISRTELGRYARGRVVLLGDAAYGNTLGGFGSGLAVLGAYTLAGELAAAGGDHRAAFAEYEEVMRPYAKAAMKGNAGPFLAPPTRARIALRNQVFKQRLLLRGMLKLTDAFATRGELRDYPQ
ncbi:FAD-dependent monooxygenase [Nonomuraea sp. NPDC049486]|uniref:FAD-dependent monooxygenase n=1 Tax=Nonomuraea sp. NPDC049486 TaxID=3155773 RepID=UPI003430BAB1